MGKKRGNWRIPWQASGRSLVVATLCVASLVWKWWMFSAKKMDCLARNFFSPAVLLVEVNERVGKKRKLPHLFLAKRGFYRVMLQKHTLVSGSSLSASLLKTTKFGMAWAALFENIFLFDWRNRMQGVDTECHISIRENLFYEFKVSFWQEVTHCLLALSVDDDLFCAKKTVPSRKDIFGFVRLIVGNRHKKLWLPENSALFKSVS